MKKKIFLIGLYTILSTLMFGQKIKQTQDSTSAKKDTTLIFECLNENWEKAKLLINKDKNINATSAGLTPLIIASAFGNLEMVKYLVMKGANVSLSTNLYTALYQSDIENGYTDSEEFNPEIVNFLVKAILSKDFYVNGKKVKLTRIPTANNLRNAIFSAMKKDEMYKSMKGIEFTMIDIIVKDPIKCIIQVVGIATFYNESMRLEMGNYQYFLVSLVADKWTAKIIKKEGTK